MELQQYISVAFPGGLRYDDAAQLCLRLYCTVDGVPEQLHAQCTKDSLADVFARLSSSGFITDDAGMYASAYGANFHAVSEKGHWVEVIASIFKKGGTVDTSAGRLLVQALNNAFKGRRVEDNARP